MNAPEPLLVVVKRLAELRDRVVFVVGIVRGLLITDAGAAPERPTDDVDVIVDVVSQIDFYRLGDRLRALGFREDSTPGAPICGWVVENVRVDVMPIEGSILGSRNRWYREATDHALEVGAGGEHFRIVNGPYFCATKLDAFADRGDGDMFHHDLEDVVAVVDGRAELHGEIEAAGDDVRRYVAEQVRGLLAVPAFVEALPGHLPGDAASQARLPIVHSRLRALASLA